MKTKYDIQLELLQEIDEICSKNNLKYILIGKSALNVFINNSIKNHYHTVSIAMTQGDIDRLCDIVEKQYKSNRYIEGIFNNLNYTHLYISYGNSNTADFRIIDVNKEICKGIQINIYPILKVAQLDGTPIVGWTSNLLREREIHKLVTKQVDNKKLWYINIVIRILKRLYKFSGGGNHYYKKVKNNFFIDKWEDIQKYSKVQINDMEFDSYLLKDIKKIDIDGIQVNMPSKTKIFIDDSFYEDYNDVSLKENRNEWIIDAEIGYEKIIEETKDILMEARHNHELIIMGRLKVRKEKENVENVWRLVQMTKKQVEYIQYFDNNGSKLFKKDLTDINQFNEVYKEIKPVINTLKKYGEYNMTFSINPNIDSLIEKVLLIKGDEELVNKLREISKNEYYIE